MRAALFALLVLGCGAGPQPTNAAPVSMPQTHEVDGLREGLLREERALSACLARELALPAEVRFELGVDGFLRLAEHPTSDCVGVALRGFTTDPRPESLSTTIEIRDPDTLEIPEHPSREEVTRVMREASAAVAQCGQGTEYVVDGRLVFVSSGRTTQVDLSGADISVLHCVGGGLRELRLSPFRRADFRVNYPFRVR